MVRKQSQSDELGTVTQKDVARRAGVTTSSVSYVINNGPRSVSPETRTRVLKAIEELGYRPNQYAQKLMRQHWGNDAPPRQFGVVLAGSRRMLSRAYYSAMTAGLYDEAVRQNYALRFFHTYNELTNPVLFNEHIHQEAIAGIILMHLLPTSQTERDTLVRINERIENIVCLDMALPHRPSIMFDKLGAGRAATDYLIQLGHTRIGYVGDVDERFDGYMQSLRRNGIEFDEQLVPFYTARQQVDLHRNSPEGGWEGAGQLLGLAKPPSAIFAASDEVAIGALRAVREANLGVPEDVSLISLDDIDLASYMSPPLTTMRVPRQQMAELAVRILVERAQNANDMAINMVLPTELIIRGSTGVRKGA